MAEIKKVNNSSLIKNFFNDKNTNNVWMSHADHVSKLPKGFKVVASSKNSKFAIIENNKKPAQAYNDIICKSNNRYIVFLHADVTFSHEFINNINQSIDRQPNFKKPNLDAWAKDIDKAIRLDNRTPEQLLNAINWINSKQGDFWKSNILSCSKLRKQYDALEAAARKGL